MRADQSAATRTNPNPNPNPNTNPNPRNQRKLKSKILLPVGLEPLLYALKYCLHKMGLVSIHRISNISLG